MAEWFVSCHAGQPNDLKTKCVIPGKMKLYFYVEDGNSLSMNGGWNLWDCLMYGDRGGPSKARREAIYVKTRDHDCLNYVFGKNPGETWMDTTVGHANIDAIGIFEVGTGAAGPVVVGPAIPVFPATVKLSAIVKAAMTANVWEVHLGTCRASATAVVKAPRWLM